MTIDEITRLHVLRRLRHFQGNKGQTAASLGVCLKTLYNYLNRYAIRSGKEADRGTE